MRSIHNFKDQLAVTQISQKQVQKIPSNKKIKAPQNFQIEIELAKKYENSIFAPSRKNLENFLSSCQSFFSLVFLSGVSFEFLGSMQFLAPIFAFNACTSPNHRALSSGLLFDLSCCRAGSISTLHNSVGQPPSNNDCEAWYDCKRKPVLPERAIRLWLKESMQ